MLYPWDIQIETPSMQWNMQICPQKYGPRWRFTFGNHWNILRTEALNVVGVTSEIIQIGKRGEPKTDPRKLSFKAQMEEEGL